MDEEIKTILESCKAFIENLRVPQNMFEAGAQIASGARLLDKINSALDTTYIVLDKEAYNQLAKAASESTWIPPEYYANDWIADCCEFLRSGNTQRGDIQMSGYITKDQLRLVLHDVLVDIKSAIADKNTTPISLVDTYIRRIPTVQPANSIPDARILFAGLEEHFTKRLQEKTSWGRNEVLVEFKHAVSEALFAFMEK